MQQIPFIDLFKSALHVSGYKLAHLQEHFLIVCKSKSAPEDGQVCRPKYAELI